MSDGNVVSGSVGELFNWIWVDIVFSIHLRAMLGIYISIFADYHLSSCRWLSIGECEVDMTLVNGIARKL